ncbi:acyloxyacyl hydrolase [Parapedobacter sp. DT-150]|uniref:acyloxyacyl hydrolase n=1 Tax=Parapedobacter sp. DT-150 TaxID=3396162 RepID=UPI003F1C3AF5
MIARFTAPELKLRVSVSVLCVALIFPVATTAQLDSIANTISVKAAYGVDVNTGNPNRKNNYYYGLHISYDKNIAFSNDEWVTFFNAKNLSFGLTWHNLNPMKELVEDVAYPGGQAFGALAEVDFQLLKLGKAKLLLTPGMGLAYISENIFTQPATSTIGSHVNLMVTGELSLEVPVSRNTTLVAGGSILHYSNGGVIVPNGGWNMITGAVGIKTALHKQVDLPDEAEADTHIAGNNAEVWFGGGVRGRYRDRHEKFFRSGAYAGYNFFINRALSLKAGSHVVYYHTVFDPSRFDETFQYYGSSLDPIRWGVAIGADFTMGRFVVNAMYGKYLHYRNYHNVQWYWMYGVRYFFTPNIGLQSTLNLHGVQADYTNWGLILRI